MKNKLTCIIIDDDDLDRMAVEAQVDNFKDLTLLASFNNPIAALSLIQSQKPAVVFLDIDMPEINGLEFIKAIENLATINVIISSHPEFALQGFQLKVFDFILKPVENERFKSCVNRILEFHQLKNKAEAYDVFFEHEKVIFKEGHSQITLNVNEILYLEAYGDYTKIVVTDKVYLTLTTLSNFIKSLPGGKFLRIHRSYVISIQKVNAYAVKNITIKGHHLPIGKTYLKEIKQIFK